MRTVPKITSIFLIIFVFCGSITSTIFGQLSLPPIFGNGMVLQRNHSIPIWGKASPKSEVTISFAGFVRTTKTDGLGEWQVFFPSLEAGGPFEMNVFSKSQQLTRNDIYIGDVWLASGQSNMELPLCNSEGAEEVMSASNDQKLRQFKVNKGLDDAPSEELPTGSSWTPATPPYVWAFSAVGYYFGNNIRKTVNIPIGIINSSFSGTRIEAWMDYNMLGDKANTKYPDGESQHQPTVAFNKMIFPLIKFPIKGIIWYQGESNAYNTKDALAYEDLFKTLIKGWRTLWDEGDIPFIWVQLPGYGKVFEQPQTLNAWSQLRSVQSSALSLPNTGEAVTIDIGSVDVHPKNKQDVGYRLSLLARKVAYGEDVKSLSPRYVYNYLRNDGKIEVSFKDIAAGLKAKNAQKNQVNGFSIADKDNNLVWANAAIEGNKVLVWSDKISNPEIIRYAWEYNPATANLYNSEDLPAAPFIAKVNHGVRINYFRLDNNSKKIGEDIKLSWYVTGATTVSLNGIQVDSFSTAKMKLNKSNKLILIAENSFNSSDKDSAIINFDVQTSELSLEQNYPNPSNPKTNIYFSLPEDGNAQIKIFDSLGREIATLIDGFFESGKHLIDWNGSNVASGIYFYSLSFKGKTLYKKMLNLK